MIHSTLAMTSHHGVCCTPADHACDVDDSPPSIAARVTRVQSPASFFQCFATAGNTGKPISHCIALLARIG